MTAVHIVRAIALTVAAAAAVGALIALATQPRNTPARLDLRDAEDRYSPGRVTDYWIYRERS